MAATIALETTFAVNTNKMGMTVFAVVRLLVAVSVATAMVGVHIMTHKTAHIFKRNQLKSQRIYFAVYLYQFLVNRMTITLKFLQKIHPAKTFAPIKNRLQ